MSTSLPQPNAAETAGAKSAPNCADPQSGVRFDVESRLEGRLGRAGRLVTPHGVIETPAFTAVGTKASVKAVLPESMAELGAQALLANAYHLYLQPGSDVIDAAGGLGAFMNWPGPTFTDSGGFQVLSLGVGFKKVLAMDAARVQADDVIADGTHRLAHVDDDGVTFTSHLSGDRHRFTPEISMRVQHELGADVIFAFDECTTLFNTRHYQERSVDRTYAWALRCVAEHQRLTAQRMHRPYQGLYGVVQGAQYEDLRRKAARDLAELRVSGLDETFTAGGTVPDVRGDGGGDLTARERRDLLEAWGPWGFDGFGIGGALEKENLAAIVGWVCSELPEGKPRHLLGISEPDDLFAGVAAGADTFDCVSPSRVARNAAVYSSTGRFNVSNAPYRRDFAPIDADCDCYTCAHYTRAYLHHLFKAHEMAACTLATIHNERFVIRMLENIRRAIVNGSFDDLAEETLGRYYGSSEPNNRLRATMKPRS